MIGPQGLQRGMQRPSSIPTRYAGAIRIWRSTPTLQYSITLGWLRFCGQLSGRFVVPEGPDDRSQAIYCLEYAQKRRTVPEGRGESGYTTYSPPMVEKRPVDRIIPFPTGRVLCVGALQAINCLATIIPSLRDKDSQHPVHKFDARSGRVSSAVPK